MSNPIFEAEKYTTAPLKVYTSISALSETTGLDKKILKIAKQRDFPGFLVNGNVNWTKLRPSFEHRYDELLAKTATDIKTLKEEIAKRDIKLKDLQIKKLEKHLLEPEDVKQFIVELATKTSVILKRELDELPPRLAGQDEPSIKIEIDKVKQTIFKALQEAETILDTISKK